MKVVDCINQAVLLILSLASAYFIARRHILGMILAMAVQPSWFLSSYMHQQWSIFLLSFYYTGMYIYGYRQWLTDPLVTKLKWPKKKENINLKSSYLKYSIAIDEARKHVYALAKGSEKLEWFFQMHQTEIVKAAEELLKHHPEANRDIVILACWLHDIAHYTAKTEEEILAVKAKHHLTGAEMAGDFLKDKVPYGIISEVCCCIRSHRNNSEAYRPVAIEQKIVAAADSLSHFSSVFYFTFFKIHPDESIENMVKNELEKIERDWRDVQILPEAAKLAQPRYEMLKEMLGNYQN